VAHPQLLLANMPQLQPGDLQPLVGHPTLRAATAHLGGARENAEAKRVLDLPDVEFTWSWRDEPE